MPRFAANLSMMYTEHPFIERFAAAAKDGFRAVEFLFPYDFPAATIAGQLKQHGLRQVLFNAPPGEFIKGERGTAALAGREVEFRSGIERALEYAAALDCPRIHVMAGLLPEGATRASLRSRYVESLAFAAERAGAAGVAVLIEPINTRDIPGYLLNRQDEAHAVVKEVGSPHLQVQMDLYHCQIVEGDVAMKLKANLPTGHVGHLQIAGVPDRHEPDAGELNYEYLFDTIDALDFPGWIGCEYRPAGATSAGLGWLRGRQRQT